MITVTVYTAAACMACVATKRHLKHRGIAYTEIPIANAVAAVLEGFTAAPVVCAATPQGEQAWDGYRPDRIDGLMAS
jgi:glutaredoxin-like protein NrdH